MQPIVGITCSRTKGGAWGVHSRGHFMDYTYSDYSQALRNAGAVPVIIPTAQDQLSLNRLMDALQGLVLSGGPDVHPRQYGEEPIWGLGEVDEVLDRMEMEAARIAIARNIPVLAICRGIQILNVTLGGTLYQDIATQLPGSLCHTPKSDKSVNVHRLAVIEGSLLHNILGETRIWVNSQHHQAIRDPAPSLIINARSSDGVIEAVVYPENPFAIGVQWHPEGTWENDAHSKKIFAALVTAARSFEGTPRIEGDDPPGNCRDTNL